MSKKQKYALKKISKRYINKIIFYLIFIEDFFDINYRTIVIILKRNAVFQKTF